MRVCEQSPGSLFTAHILPLVSHSWIVVSLCHPLRSRQEWSVLPIEFVHVIWLNVTAHRFCRSSYDAPDSRNHQDRTHVLVLCFMAIPWCLFIHIATACWMQEGIHTHELSMHSQLVEYTDLLDTAQGLPWTLVVNHDSLVCHGFSRVVNHLHKCLHASFARHISLPAWIRIGR